MKLQSLRFILLRRLLPAISLLLLAGAGTAYWIAWRSATKAYDRALFDTTLAIADQLQVVGGKPLLPLTPQARAVLLIDKFDQIFYAVRDARGNLLDGEDGLLAPPTGARQQRPEGRYYFDSHLAGKPVRVAALQKEVAGQTITVLTGETMVKRSALVQEILLGMLLPELLLGLTCLLVVWIGIKSGLRPLDSLRSELAGRSPTDLRPVLVDVPEEIQPVVTEINQLLERLAHALNSQRHFVADAAHQLRTPIAALQAQIEAAIGESTYTDGSALEGILSASSRLSHLVSQMLALARAEPSLAETRAHISLPEIIRQSAEQWLPAAFQKHIDLGFELAPAGLRGNPLLIQELLANLIDNAMQHAGKPGTVTVACGEADGQAWIRVDDNGPGIAEDDRERIFERFYRAPGSTSAGTGLGLTIVRAIARQHGGEAHAGPATLGGARLEVRFPAYRET